MKRLVKIVILLAVYLVWICGNATVALTCNAHSLYASTHNKYGCSKTCECHHEGCNVVHVETPHNCHHDHSNKIALYDTVKKNNLNIEPITLNITAQIEDNLRIEEVVLCSTHHYERKIPIPTAPTLSRRGLRAPPVVA
ncbi:MAG: hypothetical protein IIV16_04815 [Alistipes sp.]|nr:hypothetical protein [Alistipes sp.]